jgi:pyruvate dehydrogenase E1 component alpha subunit
MTAETAAAAGSYTRDEAVALIRLRYWQHQLNELLKAGEFKIPVHLAFGHEAAAVSVDRSLDSDDALCLTHRNGAYNLARAKSLQAELSHYRLQDRGAHMASMNLALPGTGIAYTSSILGNNLGVGCGIAMHRSLTGRPGLVVVMTGDGAMEEGIFWESLIFAKSHHLRLLVIVENNDFSLGSTIDERRCRINLAPVCAGLGVHFWEASGAHLPEVRQVLAEARARVAAGEPSVVELRLRTFNQHAGPTPGWPEDPRRIAIEDGLLLGSEADDPLMHLRVSLGGDAFDRLAAQVIEEAAVA